MADNKLIGKPYPTTLFLFKDVNGKFHWYKSDPFKCQNKEDEEIEIEQILTAFYGNSNIFNPLVLQMTGTVIQRCSEFQSRHIMDVHRQIAKFHYEDQEGNVVDITGDLDRNNNRYPLIGNVFDDEGFIIMRRNYALDGDCADEENSHALVCVSNTNSYVEFCERREKHMLELIKQQEEEYKKTHPEAAAQTEDKKEEEKPQENNAPAPEAPAAPSELFNEEDKEDKEDKKEEMSVIQNVIHHIRH